MSVLVTGAAGFIGFHVSSQLLELGFEVIGVDNFNDYYDVKLKESRFELLKERKGLSFMRINIADKEKMFNNFKGSEDITSVVHLAAQAGVRYSLVNPYAYIESNVMGQLVLLELCRTFPNLKHLVYASSSSVYGGNQKLPFSEKDPVDQPVSLYAATKKTDELMGNVYSNLYGMRITGLRFFTVYGPWGRPDMSAYIFTKAIFEDRPIQLFNNGNMRRDFTFIDDIAEGVLSVLNGKNNKLSGDGKHQIYNIGNNRPEELIRYIEVLEESIGKAAIIENAPMQPGDVTATYADISAINNDFGFIPKTPIENGLPKFVEWYRDFHGII